jgi:hypothetical protein
MFLRYSIYGLWILNYFYDEMYWLISWSVLYLRYTVKYDALPTSPLLRIIPTNYPSYLSRNLLFLFLLLFLSLLLLKLSFSIIFQRQSNF